MAEGTEQQIVKLAATKTLSKEVREDLITKVEAYKRLIHKMAHKYVRNRVEYDDLMQEAFIGLACACRDFDPKRSTNFHTYAIYRMKGRMYEYCIGNESPIYIPTHVAKAASYVRQMHRLLDKEPSFFNGGAIAREIVAAREHPREEDLNDLAQRDLKELKRKLGNIAHNSRMEYETLAALASESLSLIVSDEVLAKYPKENELIDDIVSNQERRIQLRESLGEKRFTVLLMRHLGWNLREIAEHLETLGYTNRQGERISRQAVLGIYKDTLQALSRTRLFHNLKREDILGR